MEKQMPLVSIITPSYNSEKFISETIKSVRSQTYTNWELIIVDDCSTDSTVEIVQSYQILDKRIKLYKLDVNSGPAIARNKAIEVANGNYIAFLDADDLWHSEKLSCQIEYMQKNNVSFCCTYYQQIDEAGKELHKIVKYKDVVDYKELLKESPGNSTVVYNCKLLGKIYVKNIRKRNDYVLWLDVIKKSGKLYCLNKILMDYRIVRNSISRKKIKLIKYHWIIYRNIEKLSTIKSIFLILYWCGKGILKKIKSEY